MDLVLGSVPFPKACHVRFSSGRNSRDLKPRTHGFDTAITSSIPAFLTRVELITDRTYCALIEIGIKAKLPGFPIVGLAYCALIEIGIKAKHPTRCEWRSLIVHSLKLESRQSTDRSTT